MYPPGDISSHLHVAGRHEDMKNVFHFQLSSLSPVHHSHINSFCQSHKQFSCPPDALPCHRSFSKRGIPQEWQMRRKRKRQHKKGFLQVFPNTQREKKMLFCCLFSLTPLPVDSQQWMCRHLLQGDDKRDEDEWRSTLRDKSSVCLSFFLSVFTSPSLPLLTAYDDVTRLLSRYMHPSFTHQAACNRTIPQFIFHIIVSPFWACHRGLA